MRPHVVACEQAPREFLLTCLGCGQAWDEQFMATALADHRCNRPAVREVFDAWRESTGRTRARLTPERDRLIRARLRTYPLDDLLAAVRGWECSPFHRGENDDGTVWNDLELVLRVSQKTNNIERFRDLYWQSDPSTGQGEG